MPTITCNPTPLLLVGDALVSRINGYTWQPPGPGGPLDFTAQRLWAMPEYPPTNNDLHVDLIPYEVEKELSDRGGSTERVFTWAIGVQQNFGTLPDVDEVDALANFVGALCDLFKLQEEFTVGDDGQLVHCNANKLSVVFSPEELNKNNRFFAAIRLDLEGWFERGA